jgi:arylsulfatase A-like enzyme
VKARNVLFIISDEHQAQAMSCAGHPLVKTPNMDALAARGVRFTNAYTPSPICVPARASLATGLYAHQTGYWDNALAYDGRIKGWGHALHDAGIIAMKATPPDSTSRSYQCTSWTGLGKSGARSAIPCRTFTRRRNG